LFVIYILIYSFRVYDVLANTLMSYSNRFRLHIIVISNFIDST